MKCQDFFEENADNPKPCKALQKLFKDDEATVLGFEQSSASPLSEHGPVRDDEFLWRQIVNPTHFDVATGQLKVTAFSDVSDKGGSVNRGYADYQALVLKAEKRVADINSRRPDMQASLVGLVRLECDEVRAIRTPPGSDGKTLRGFIVLDTALPGDESHADICQIVSQDAHGRSVRSKLVELANRYLLKIREESAG